MANGVSNWEQENKAEFASSEDEQNKFGCIVDPCMSPFVFQKARPAAIIIIKFTNSTL